MAPARPTRRPTRPGRRVEGLGLRFRYLPIIPSHGYSGSVTGWVEGSVRYLEKEDVGLLWV